MYGGGAFGETSFGESPGGAFPSIVGVVGSMGVLEAKDIFAATGIVPPPVSISVVANQNMLVLVIELEMGQLP